MKKITVTVPTRTGRLTVEGPPLAVVRILLASLPLVFASPERAAEMTQEAARIAEQHGLSVRRWRDR